MTKKQITDKLAQMNEQIGAELASALLMQKYKKFQHSVEAIRTLGITLFFPATSYPRMINTKVEAKKFDMGIVKYVKDGLKQLHLKEKDISEKGRLLHPSFLKTIVAARNQEVQHLVNELSNLKTYLLKKYFADIPAEFEKCKVLGFTKNVQPNLLH